MSLSDIKIVLMTRKCDKYNNIWESIEDSLVALVTWQHISCNVPYCGSNLKWQDSEFKSFVDIHIAKKFHFHIHIITSTPSLDKKGNTVARTTNNNKAAGVNTDDPCRVLFRVWLQEKQSKKRFPKKTIGRHDKLELQNSFHQHKTHDGFLHLRKMLHLFS